MQIRDNSQSHFERIGGEPVVAQLVNRFYDIMESDAQTRGILALHPKDLSTSRQKLYEFLVGWLGGPPLYVNKYGHPRMRMRHMHVAIGEQERDQWMYCMENAMQDLNIEPELQKELHQALYKLADFMRNQ